MTAEASAAMGQYLAERIHILERGVVLLPKRQRLSQELRAWQRLQDTLGAGAAQ